MNRCPFHLDRRRSLGMTLAETLIAGIVVILVFALISAVSASLRADDAETRTQDTLAALQAALLHHGRPLPDDAALALRRLLLDDGARQALVAVAVERGPDGAPVVRDAYGHALIYRPDPTGHGVGQFVSPGPDGRLGDAFADNPAARRAAADNLYGRDTETPQP